MIGRADSDNGTGVLGYSGFSDATSTGLPVGVYGQADSPDGWAGYFYSPAGNGVSVSTPPGTVGLNVAGGTKNAVVATKDGARLLYAEEATSVVFTDYGRAHLVAGKATIALDPRFVETVDLSAGYDVFVQPYGRAALAVVDRSAARFSVEALSGDDAAEFAFRVVAPRRGYRGERLKRAPWADDDPDIFPGKSATRNAARVRRLPDR